MLTLNDCFIPFKDQSLHGDTPESFTFPFYYQPHPLAIQAASELQQHLKTQQEWQHNFGLNGNLESAIGKMFGVLVVENENGQLGYLAGFSGKLADKNILAPFVPPIFDMLTESSFFLKEQRKINKITKELEDHPSSTAAAILHAELKQTIKNRDEQIANHRAKMIEGRKQRKLRRNACDDLPTEERNALKTRLNQESVIEKLQLRDLKQHWQALTDGLNADIALHQKNIDALLEERKQRSSTLQQTLFEQYRFLNANGDESHLQTLFSKTSLGVPPAGAGECAAPKLLQFAYKHHLRPVVMAEFWWGRSPKSEIRKHGHFYPSCHGKCEPILTHMLQGLTVDDNPLLNNPAQGKELPIVYYDEHIVVVNKPAEFLSVPGKTIQDSVYTRIKQQFPSDEGPLVVHRLDMSTSGLMVFARSRRANKHLQQQFIQRTVNKCYTALLDCEINGHQGVITLPLRGDLYDRPRQLVCFEHGKPAETEWEVIEKKQGQTKVHLFPKTGRTHQLRVHCAHQLGLNASIVGDDLYGVTEQRLHLHAGLLEFEHPVTQKMLKFEIAAPF
ncbi:pseudouridine synthase [Thaumasiovibrio sp. DFM-14]|uniref:RluA family pseudouridine synthase n=1 Tax=Thaumasiovibrio sp. DFM-14 TaxID=3384792 RepID=UPI0039A1C778